MWVQSLCSNCSQCDLHFFLPVSFPFPQTHRTSHPSPASSHFHAFVLSVPSASSATFPVKPARPCPTLPLLNQAASSVFEAHSVYTATAESPGTGLLDVKGGSSLIVPSLDAQYLVWDFIQPKNSW